MYPLSKNLHESAMLNHRIDELILQRHSYLSGFSIPHYLFITEIINIQKNV
jgi:hypothetical protein